jgi:uncharacterized protein (DUF2147 family)
MTFSIACPDTSGDPGIQDSRLNRSDRQTIFPAVFETGATGVNRSQRKFPLGWRRSFYSLVTAFAIGMTPTLSDAAEADPPGALGFWLSGKKKTAIEFYPCDDKLCATIVWLAKPYRRSGEFKRDSKNPDPALRARGWCGIEVVKGLKAKRANVWSRGKFYYPKKGKTYDLDIKLLDDGQLEMRAYLGFRLLGKTEIWSRPEHDRTFACVPAPDS